MESLGLKEDDLDDVIVDRESMSPDSTRWLASAADLVSKFWGCQLRYIATKFMKFTQNSYNLDLNIIINLLNSPRIAFTC